MSATLPAAERCRLKPFSDGIFQIDKARENNVQ
uniref:Uncharacterized protein n=1 Tax=Neisseria meningitidis alpha153 TaxID=663926 RepID=C6SED8_NEIME|nr:hypothetical protein predicted by Glimmer/Critica [Neisseria meningitidis alpha153]